ncbi:MAG: dihydrofolate reductase family protein [Pseudomonadota bacterium]
MQSIIYDVAVSIDGYIAGPAADVSKFPAEGEVVADYFERLSQYRCAIMGRATYEFAYDYGLRPGDNPYPHMQTLVFSKTMPSPSEPNIEIVRGDAVERIAELRGSADGPIYLCGGGAFAGWLLSQGLIDTLRLKRAPILLGGGTRLFGDQAIPADLQISETKPYDGGAVFQAFDLMPARSGP